MSDEYIRKKGDPRYPIVQTWPATRDVEIPNHERKTKMKIKLPRTGRAPLEFDGEKIAEVSTQNLRGSEQNRWYEITLYQTENPPEHGGRHIVHIGYRTNWQGETHHDLVVIRQHIPEVSYDLEHLDPVPIGVGFPPRKEFDDRQLALRMDLISQYCYAVSKVLEDFPEVLG